MMETAHTSKSFSTMRLSRHFCENWAARVGGTPSAELVEKIIADGIRVQTGQLMRDYRGNNTNTLSIYWAPELDVVVKIDQFSRTAVSVLSGAMKKKGGTQNG